MNSATVQRDALMPREPRGMGSGLLLALLVHAGLIVALAVGVSWKSAEPEGVEAELWAAVPQAAAPRAVEPPPAPAPPPPPPQKAVESQPDLRMEAQIAIEKEREKQRREKLKADEEKKQEEARKREQQKQEQLKQDKLKQEKLKQEQKVAAEKKEAERERREQVERDAAKLDAQRKENLKRIAGLAGATGAANATGTAMQSRGASSGYGGRIVAALKPHLVYSDNPPGNPRTEVRIEVAPSGTITGKRITKSSGNPSWDDAVMRALDKAQRLPLDTDGTVQNPTIISWGPND